jgi:hypothetical protein
VPPATTKIKIVARLGTALRRHDAGSYRTSAFTGGCAKIAHGAGARARDTRQRLGDSL